MNASAATTAHPIRRRVGPLGRRTTVARTLGRTCACVLLLAPRWRAAAFTLRMGLLSVGKPKPFEASKPDLRYIRRAGVRQFISTYERVKDLRGDDFFWGEEVEYGIFSLDASEGRRRIRLSLRGREVMDRLNDLERHHEHRAEGCSWVPEYGSWMVEATPSRPYTGYSNDLLRVERNMRLRRARLMTALREDEIAPTVSCFPLLGAHGDILHGAPEEGTNVARSAYLDDAVINPHPRFAALTANIRARRGSQVNIRVPLFSDVNTPEYQTLAASEHDCACDPDALMTWPYGRSDRFGLPDGYVAIGCSGTTGPDAGDPITLQKYTVDVREPGCEGLYYRFLPGMIANDAGWPRNGDQVLGYEITGDDLDVPGRWVRLQNGYYLPLSNLDNTAAFLHPADKHTDRASSEASSRLLRPAIHMDAMAFGMGCCCLQVTFQAQDIDESRFLHDQLAVLAPIMMALTASTPILKGRLADTDARWGIISESVDDRTPAERGCDDDPPSPHLAGRGRRRLYKSRYDSISAYIYQGACGDAADDHEECSVDADQPPSYDGRILNRYNDIPVPVDEEMYATLREAGVDPALSQHVAHLFVRDPLVVFEGSVEEIDDDAMTEHFESIQSTNWQTVRWKPPPPRTTPNDPHIGWRTEFRSMEMQLTDFENAAFSVFVVLLTRVILAFDLNLYLPISRVDANMQRAHSRNAARRMPFFFRRHLAPLSEGDDGYGRSYSSVFSTEEVADADEEPDPVSNTVRAEDLRRCTPCAGGGDEENSYEEMTLEEIFTGKGPYFPGLVPLVAAYLDHIDVDADTRAKLAQYLALVEKRATGELLTPAAWMRRFVRAHPAYKFDSVVSDEIAHDLMVACQEIGEGKRHEPDLTGDVVIEPVTVQGVYDKKLDSGRIKDDRLTALLRRYTKRADFGASGRKSAAEKEVM